MDRNDTDGSTPESPAFDLGLRAITQDAKTIRIVTNKTVFEMDRQVSFDSEQVMVSAAEYFLGSLAGSILLTILEHARREHRVIEEIEGRLRGSIENPLTLLGVKGYHQAPAIGAIQMDIYLCADLDEEELQPFCQQALERSPVYNSLRDCLNIVIRIKPVY
jgi:uncharacterized OsmC-like protein